MMASLEAGKEVREGSDIVAGIKVKEERPDSAAVPVPAMGVKEEEEEDGMMYNAQHLDCGMPLGLEEVFEMLLKAREGAFDRNTPKRSTASPIDPNMTRFYVIPDKKRTNPTEGELRVKYSNCARSKVWWSTLHDEKLGLVCRSMSMKTRSEPHEQSKSFEHGFQGHWVSLVERDSSGPLPDKNFIRQYVLEKCPSLVQFWPSVKRKPKRERNAIGARIRKGQRDAVPIPPRTDAVSYPPMISPVRQFELDHRISRVPSADSTEDGYSSGDVFLHPEIQPLDGGYLLEEPNSAQSSPSNEFQQHPEFGQNARGSSDSFASSSYASTFASPSGTVGVEEQVTPQKEIFDEEDLKRLKQRRGNNLAVNKEDLQLALNCIMCNDPEELDNDPNGLEDAGKASILAFDLFKNACDIMGPEEFAIWYQRHVSKLFEPSVMVRIKDCLDKHDERISPDFLVPENVDFLEDKLVADCILKGNYKDSIKLHKGSLSLTKFAGVETEGTVFSGLSFYDDLLESQILDLFGHLVYKKKSKDGLIDPLRYFYQTILRLPNGKRIVARIQLKWLVKDGEWDSRQGSVWLMEAKFQDVSELYPQILNLEPLPY